MSVIFTSCKALERAENIRAVYDRLDCKKAFAKVQDWRKNPDLAPYRVRVTDEFVTASPGKVIMIGHSMCGGKTYGLDQPRPYFDRRYSGLLDFVIASGRECIPFVAKQCGVPEERVLALGTPRSDACIGKGKGDGKTFLYMYRAYLYAPTYRGSGEPPMPDIDWKLLDGMLTDKEILAVKPHTMTGSVLHGHYRHIVEISANDPSMPYVMDCDVLITDYSSILFDAQLMKKPVILFEKRPGYVQSRGMYFRYPEEYASRYCTDEKTLACLLKIADGQNDADRQCVERVCGACDGHATERVVRLIKEQL